MIVCMRRCPCLVLIPVGPGTSVEFLQDTVDSIVVYGIPGHRILLADDSGQGVCDRIKGVDVMSIRDAADKTRRTVTSAFFGKVCQGIGHSVKNYDFEVLLRIDADALMVNSGSEHAAIDHFSKNPRVGQIGSYRMRCDGQARDFSWPANNMRNEQRYSLIPKKRALALSMKRLISEAKNYELGEHVIAPGSFMSRAAVEAVVKHPLFGHKSFGITKLGDDHLTSLMVMACGFSLGDFATGDKPLGIWLRKIEWPPEELVQRGKAIVHSVRGYQELGEGAVRERFRKLRSKVEAKQL